MSRPRPLSGFPEFTPEGRVVEQAVLDRLRQTFELHGFASIETRAVEPLDRLAKQGEIDKEVYAVQRLHAALVRQHPPRWRCRSSRLHAAPRRWTG